MSNKKIKELENKLSEINDKVLALNNESFDLQQSLMVEQQEHLKVLVGKYVRRNNDIFKIIGVPEIVRTSNQPYFTFSPSHLPVVRLSNVEIEKTTIFSRAYLYDDPLAQLYEEFCICSEEHFKRRLENIKEHWLKI